MTTMTAEASLTTAHLAQLRDGSGVSPEVIQERGYRSITQLTALRDFGFSAAQCRTVPGLLIPQRHTDGSSGRYTFKPDNPRVVISKRSNKERVIKYENPEGSSVRLDCPPRCRPHLGNPAVELWITEGAKKSDAGASHGLCIIALNGVWGFKGKNAFGGVTILADWDYVALKGRSHPALRCKSNRLSPINFLTSPCWMNDGNQPFVSVQSPEHAANEPIIFDVSIKRR